MTDYDVQQLRIRREQMRLDAEKDYAPAPKACEGVKLISWLFCIALGALLWTIVLALFSDRLAMSIQDAVGLVVHFLKGRP
jgi:hypothetical protein